MLPCEWKKPTEDDIPFRLSTIVTPYKPMRPDTEAKGALLRVGPLPTLDRNTMDASADAWRRNKVRPRLANGFVYCCGETTTKGVPCRGTPYLHAYEFVKRGKQEKDRVLREWSMCREHRRTFQYAAFHALETIVQSARISQMLN